MGISTRIEVVCPVCHGAKEFEYDEMNPNSIKSLPKHPCCNCHGKGIVEYSVGIREQDSLPDTINPTYTWQESGWTLVKTTSSTEYWYNGQ